VRPCALPPAWARWVMTMSAGKTVRDAAVRAMTDDGAFRVVTVRTTDTVQRMLELQTHTTGNARHLGELITGAVLVRETMAPDYRLQTVLRSSDNRYRLVADSHPDGGSRGLITGKNMSNTDVPLTGATLEVMRTLYNGTPNRGVVAVPDGGSMSQALMTYLQTSEQVASMLAVACVVEDKRVIAAGGYLVQLLPEVGRGPLAIMAERLNDFREISELLARSDAAPSPLLDEILYGMPFTPLSERPLSWKCRCSTVRVMSSLATLPKAELMGLIEDGKPIELSCDFCGQAYNISPTQLAGLMNES
jgi:molecular chaperone Hsp33